MPDGHPAAKYKYNNLKETYGAQENGDIVIDRRTVPASETVKEPEKTAAPVETKTNGVSASVAEIKVGA